ncbi:MAG: prephenate dehydratase [Clostridiales bacterium]|nr:prephenate dehydratase [Clostridiales bacterium]
MAHKEVGYQGVTGSYSEEALIAYFGGQTKRKNYKAFKDLFRALDLGEVQYAVVPIENSSTGAIREVYDLLVEGRFFIVGEYQLRIHHNLLVVKGVQIADIEVVYSHTQGIEQCSCFLEEHPQWKRIPYFNTARSAKFVAESGEYASAAIGSIRAAEIYGLSVLRGNIQDNFTNTTRFVILSQEMETTKSSDKISLVFTTKHVAGALYGALSKFADYNINMTKIESRPIKNKPWEYYFFIDIEGKLETSNVLKALSVMEQESRYFKILGNYAKGNGDF